MRSLTDKQILEVRELYKSGLYNKKELAEMYGCSQTTIALWLPEVSEYREFKIRYKKRTINICEKCGVSWKKHKRCEKCTKLIHDNEVCEHEPYIKKYKF